MRLNNVSSSSFTWSTSEQEYTLEKAADGSTLYAKQVDMGNLPNNGARSVAHGISGLTSAKVHRIWATAGYNSSSGTPVPSTAQGNIAQQITLDFDGSNIRMFDGWDFSAGTAIAYIIYKK